MVSNVVGKSLPRLEGREKVTGQALYVDDLFLPRMLQGKLLRSPYPHARIVSIDTSRAESLPGVKAVITAADLPDRRHGPFVKDTPVLARGEVKYAGEPVAAVAAVSLEAAESALGLIRIEYEHLPEVLDAHRALEPGSPLVHESLEPFAAVFKIMRWGNVCSHTLITEGDIEQGFRDADFVFEDTFHTPMVHQTYLEPNGALAAVDAQGNVTVWTATQSAHITRIRLGETLDLPLSKVRVIQTRVGGAFGAKLEPTVQPVCAALAQKTGRPVKIVLTREEEFTATRPRHAAAVTVRTGVRKDGTLLARHIKLVFDTGAYADDGPAVTALACILANGPYRLPNYRIEGYCVYTNKVAAGAYRGFGNPQAAWAGESQLDIIARQLGISPLEIRLRNALEPGERTVGGQKLGSVGLKECLQAAVRELKWGEPKPANRGRGLACVHHMSALLTASATVRLDQDGTVHVAVGTADIGQGSDTVLAQIAAAELGIALEHVGIVTRDTDATPYGWATVGTRSTYMAGNAVQRAAADLKSQLLSLAAGVLGVEAAGLRYEEGAVVADDGSRKLDLAQLALVSHWAKGGQIIGKHSWMYDLQPYGKEVQIDGFPLGILGAYNYGVQAVEVEVDGETGMTRVVQAVAAHDVGRAVNPAATEGQAEGGFVQGLGYALFEDLKVREGRIVTRNLLDYKIPTAADVPPIKVVIVESNEPTGPFGAKGIGEAPVVPAAPAIANAVEDATGVRVKELPVSPERLLAALNTAKG